MAIIERIAKDLAHPCPRPRRAILPPAMFPVEHDRRLEERDAAPGELANARDRLHLVRHRHQTLAPAVEPERDGTVDPELVAPAVELEKRPLPRPRRFDVPEPQ